LVNRSFYYSIFTTIQYKNNLIPLILIISLIVLFLSIYFNPVRNIFDFVQLPAADILLCFIAAIVGVVWIEGYKFVKRKAGQQK